VSRSIKLGERLVGEGQPAYLIAELSANHNGSLERAKEIIGLAAEAGADAIKLQTYTADTMTIDCDKPFFRIEGGLWDGYGLHALYEEAHTPWEWHAELFAEAARLGLDCFSTPFDATSVHFLEQFDPIVYKVASFELTDHALLRTIAATGRPIIMSTGMASLEEIGESVDVLRAAGCEELALLRCVSSYPAQPGDFNLLTIPYLAETFDVVSGLSDHSMGHTTAVGGVTLGAAIIEKHFIARRSDGGPDSAFSMEPAEFASMVQAIRDAEAARGEVNFGPGLAESANVIFRRSCFAVQDIAAGEALTADNIRVIRPGYGLAPKHHDSLIGRVALTGIERGTPLSWDQVGAARG
jgi:pseudaminic acid synthase